jgi:hypothetical protein
MIVGVDRAARRVTGPLSSVPPVFVLVADGATVVITHQIVI